MNEQLQQALADLLNKSIAVFEKGGEFMQEQLPDVINQLLIWHGVYKLILFIFAVLWFVIVTVAAVKYGKWVFRTDKLDEMDKMFFGFCLGSIGAALAYIPTLVNMNVEWLQIWIAPKVWLIEYAAKIVK